MRAFWHRHRALIGYIFIVLVAAAALEAHAAATTRDLNGHDARSCRQRNKLAANQRAVLDALSYVLSIEVDEAGKEHQIGSRLILSQRLRDLERRRITAGPETC